MSGVVGFRQVVSAGASSWLARCARALWPWRYKTRMKRDAQLDEIRSAGRMLLHHYDLLQTEFEVLPIKYKEARRYAEGPLRQRLSYMKRDLDGRLRSLGRELNKLTENGRCTSHTKTISLSKSWRILKAWSEVETSLWQIQELLGDFHVLAYEVAGEHIWMRFLSLPESVFFESQLSKANSALQEVVDLPAQNWVDIRHDLHAARQAFDLWTRKYEKAHTALQEHQEEEATVLVGILEDMTDGILDLCDRVHFTSRQVAEMAVSGHFLCDVLDKRVAWVRKTVADYQGSHESTWRGLDLVERQVGMIRSMLDESSPDYLGANTALTQVRTTLTLLLEAATVRHKAALGPSGSLHDSVDPVLALSRNWRRSDS